MRNSKKVKQRLKAIPRHWCRFNEDGTENKRPRYNAIYFTDWCCSDCYFTWGRYWEKRTMYGHNFAYSNYCGLLKKYWKQNEISE